MLHSHEAGHPSKRDIRPFLVQCWASVVDAGPALTQQWINDLCLVQCHLQVHEKSPGVILIRTVQYSSHLYLFYFNSYYWYSLYTVFVRIGTMCMYVHQRNSVGFRAPEPRTSGLRVRHSTNECVEIKGFALSRYRWSEKFVQHKTLIRCWLKVVPASQTMAKHLTSIDSVYFVYWVRA